MTGRRLVLFAKEPVAGEVKTRLAARLGEEAAARLYEAFLSDLAEELAAPGEWEALVAHTGEAPGPVLSLLFASGWRFLPQGDGDLGARLARPFESARSEGALAVAAGSDSPTLRRADVRRAFAALEAGADVVFAPSPDGGYALVGLGRRAAAEDVFRSVRFSTGHALADTRANAKSCGLVTAVIEGVPDVDVAGDLDAVRALLAETPHLAPATRRALALDARRAKLGAT